ncbi:hypothetical protein [Massilia sp. 9096]|uniref:hypothetical protein n=1 Tax=Massilia sp. 9096 TaxID=1500894 RepID=UPI000A813778|nr:hypothetical protein [Massilia sp. 9096]
MAPSRHLFRSLVLLSCVLPAAAMACAILPQDKDLERSRKIVDEFKEATSKLMADADLIFVGHITKLDYQRDTDEKSPGRVYLAQFVATDEIKGQYPRGQALELTLHNRVYLPLGCRPAYWQLPKENGVGEAYLVYAKDGKILRTNHIVTDRQAMSAYEEEQFVRDHP